MPEDITTDRPSVIHPVKAPPGTLHVQERLGLAHRIWNLAAVRKLLVLVALASIWEAYARWFGNTLLFPTLSETIQALWAGIVSGKILWATLSSLSTAAPSEAARTPEKRAACVRPITRAYSSSRPSALSSS